MRRCSLPFHQGYLVIFTTADIPGKILKEEILFLLPTESMDILTGILWVTLVKFPEALLAGISENTDAVLVPVRKTLP
jgi:hypothetical protein